MWGPSNALLEENLSSDEQGLTPRVFEHLFARINEVNFDLVEIITESHFPLIWLELLFYRSKLCMLTNN